MVRPDELPVVYERFVPDSRVTFPEPKPLTDDDLVCRSETAAVSTAWCQATMPTTAVSRSEFNNP